jgi:hypothetical protein
MKGGCLVFDLELCFDLFVAWLCEHEHDIVGIPSAWCDDPLSRWLSERAGRLYGVDGTVYGSALLDMQYWRRLPSWCQLFVLLTEKYAFQAMTGLDVFRVLADIEQRHRSVLNVA